MNELNPSQSRISGELEGMIVVDAGPGTGKTHTIVDRFINILNKENVDPKDVWLLTFTRNAASEMEERIRGKMTKTGISGMSKFIQTGTFDSFCYSVVMESPESISKFFRMDEVLTRGASLIENDTLNSEYFRDFFDRFVNEKSDEYGHQSIIASQNVSDVYDVINRLMSKGIIPLRNGWFGGNDGKELIGDINAVLRKLESLNDVVSSRGICKLSSDLHNRFPSDEELRSFDHKVPIPTEILEASAKEDRNNLLALIHDVYYEYIRSCIINDRLTFGLVSSFAFIVLYSDRKTRERMSCRYLMIDEFQDTNENQLMIALMLLKEPNLCVVGDWKQGIYGFRYVDIDNITRFEEKVKRLIKILNDDIERVPFASPDIIKLPLDISYRSSQLVIDTAFRSLYVAAVEDEEIDREELDRNIVRIDAFREDIGNDTSVEYISAESKDEEVRETIRKIEDYVKSGKYVIHDGDASRPPDYGDIGVLCRNTNMCRAIYDAASSCGMPAFLQGDIEIMSTREGKLALAWLKYINNEKDEWGLNTILADMGYTLADIRSLEKTGPEDIVGMRKSLVRKKRRITDLLASIFSFYGLNNDITQTIISIISSSHRNSLLTISDVIGMIEKDIENGTKYSVDGMLDRKAVMIQTMHKSKGLEYPVVIIAGLDNRVIPNTSGNKSKYSFDRTTGLRCKESISEFGDGYSCVAESWRTYLAERTLTKDYSEDRRMMFVAISRAKQYVTMIAGPKSSPFFSELGKGQIKKGGKGSIKEITSKEEQKTITPPAIDGNFVRRENVGVHSIMRSIGELRPDETTDEFSGKGKEYGTEIHELALAIVLGKEINDERPEIPLIRDIIASVSDADLVLPEIECSLPFNEYNVTLRGVIDLLAVYPDKILIHDYKTDVERAYEEEYRIQLSVYAHAASDFYKKPAICIIDYVSRKETVRFEPLDRNIIAERVKTYIDL
jgi:ATP-dependent exoDNAse (exonuclease V) beta subunit (contains helicase and exonuclease domains)